VQGVSGAATARRRRTRAGRERRAQALGRAGGRAGSGESGDCAGRARSAVLRARAAKRASSPPATMYSRIVWSFHCISTYALGSSCALQSYPTSSRVSRMAQLSLSSSLSIFPFGNPQELPFQPLTSSSFVKLGLRSIAPQVGICCLYVVKAS
jgi:hypothetical protein